MTFRISDDFDKINNWRRKLKACSEVLFDIGNRFSRMEILMNLLETKEALF